MGFRDFDLYPTPVFITECNLTIQDAPAIADGKLVFRVMPQLLI
jgi:hypothetical protein